MSAPTPRAMRMTPPSCGSAMHSRAARSTCTWRSGPKRPRRPTRRSCSTSCCTASSPAATPRGFVHERRSRAARRRSTGREALRQPQPIHRGMRRRPSASYPGVTTSPLRGERPLVQPADPLRAKPVELPEHAGCRLIEGHHNQPFHEVDRGPGDHLVARRRTLAKTTAVP